MHNRERAKYYHKTNTYLWMTNLLGMWWNQLCPTFHYCEVRGGTASFWRNLWR